MDAIIALTGIGTVGLFTDNYQCHMNTPYCHTLTNKQVSYVLARFVDRGIAKQGMQFDFGFEPWSWQLTEFGMQLWEQERKADWGKFLWREDCFDIEADSDIVSVCGLYPPLYCLYSPNRSLIESQIELDRLIGCPKPLMTSKIVYQTEEDVEIIGGKRISVLHVAYVPVEDPENAAPPSAELFTSAEVRQLIDKCASWYDARSWIRLRQKSDN